MQKHPGRALGKEAASPFSRGVRAPFSSRSSQLLSILFHMGDAREPPGGVAAEADGHSAPAALFRRPVPLPPFAPGRRHPRVSHNGGNGTLSSSQPYHSGRRLFINRGSFLHVAILFASLPPLVLFPYTSLLVRRCVYFFVSEIRPGRYRTSLAFVPVRCLHHAARSAAARLRRANPAFRRRLSSHSLLSPQFHAF